MSEAIFWQPVWTYETDRTTSCSDQINRKTWFLMSMRQAIQLLEGLVDWTMHFSVSQGYWPQKMQVVEYADERIHTQSSEIVVGSAVSEIRVFAFLRKNAKNATSQKRHFRPQFQNSENTKNHLRRHLRPLKSGFSTILRKQRIFTKTPSDVGFAPFGILSIHIQF